MIETIRAYRGRELAVAVIMTGLLAGCGGASTTEEAMQPSCEQPFEGDRKDLTQEQRLKICEKVYALDGAPREVPEMAVGWLGAMGLRTTEDGEMVPLEMPQEHVMRLEPYASEVYKRTPQDGTVKGLLGLHYLGVDKPDAGRRCFSVEIAERGPQKGVDVSEDICQAVWNIVLQSGTFDPRRDLGPNAPNRSGKPVAPSEASPEPKRTL